MATDCTVIAAAHPDSAADEVIGDAGFMIDPTVDSQRDSTPFSAASAHRLTLSNVRSNTTGML
nr:hypothetical protein [Haloarcula argentinensis]